MRELLPHIITILVAVISSSGFWAYMQRYSQRHDAKTDMLVGLAHDRIMSLGREYIEKGYIGQEEYENLKVYLYDPYHKLGGNGSAERVMREVENLPIKY